MVYQKLNVLIAQLCGYVMHFYVEFKKIKIQRISIYNEPQNKIKQCDYDRDCENDSKSYI